MAIALLSGLPRGQRRPKPPASTRVEEVFGASRSLTKAPRQKGKFPMKREVLDVEGWREVVAFEDDASGLKAIVAIHNAALGPGCGGTRIRPYGSFEEALEDVKKLSRGMTYKNALGGIPFGGGKAVIIADPKTDKTPELFQAYGKAIDSLEGRYYTAEDSGVTEHDLQIVREQTPFVAGVASEGEGGNPSPFTARGVWRGIQSAARFKFGAASLEQITVAILGVGAVGMELARLLHTEGAKLIVADVDQAATAKAAEQFGAEIVAPEDCIAARADVFSPCALGGAIRSGEIERLHAAIVAGAANNQLATPEMDAALRERDILYAPDYVINAAGVISVGLEILNEWCAEEMNARIDHIGPTLRRIFERAEEEGRPTGEIADRMAMEIISRAAAA